MQALFPWGISFSSVYCEKTSQTKKNGDLKSCKVISNQYFIFALQTNEMEKQLSVLVSSLIY